MQHLARFLATTAVAITAVAQSIVIPNGLATTEGSGSNGLPWGRGGGGLLIQQVYDSSHFTAQGIDYPILVNRLRWRPNGGSTLFGGNYPTGAIVRLSTCPLDQLAVSTVFASNQGPDLTTVFSGPVSWPGAAATPGPSPFGIDIWFTTNFLYDPNGGDLNIETDLPVQSFSGSLVQLDVSATAALASRIYLSGAGYPGPIGWVDLNYGTVVEVDYVPAPGLFASFLATPTSGASPLLVHFTDHSASSDPGGIVAWAWDFDGDNVIDSNLQNPSFTYTSCGTYDVSLMVVDTSHGPATKTRTAFVRTDPITPNFTWTQLSLNTYQFTDTTTPAATAWAWDFDNDGITDSIVQHPVATLTGHAPTVRLTATRLCQTASKTASLLNTPFRLPTIMTGGTGIGGIGGGNLFDIQVTAAEGINIFGLTVAPYSVTIPIGTVIPVTVWVTDAAGGYLANHTNAAVWRQVATGTTLFAGGTLAAPLPHAVAFTAPVYLPSGSYAMAVHLATSGLAHTAGTGANQTYSNADLTLNLGIGKSAPPFGTTMYTPRVWNGAIHYSKSSVGGEAGYGFFGAGCAGTIGIANLQPANLPRLGQIFTLGVTNVPSNAALMMVGLSRTASPFGALPLNLTAFGAPGCLGRVSPDATQFLLGTGNQAVWTFGIPNNASLSGMPFFNQALVFDAGFNTLNAVVSDAAAAIIGN